MNVPTEFDQGIPPGFDPLPFMRQFLLPEEGHVWLKRDFSSQEIRIAAHFEDGVLLEAYIGNPNLDPHEMARVMIESITGLQFARKHVKITGFQIIYGGGQRAIAGQVGCSENEAAILKQSYFQAMPGIMQLSRQVNALGRSGQHITTWGGRKYFAEIGKDGRNFSYKLLNYLIQGSAADQTKQALIDWDSTQEGATFLATVHDEINISAPADNWEPHMRHLREMMNYPRLDCPMESEGFYGPNWHELTETT
jgi:DNA polymerase I-like protein with 3'-5' exonuclease and polymerase domains